MKAGGKFYLNKLARAAILIAVGLFGFSQLAFSEDASTDKKDDSKVVAPKLTKAEKKSAAKSPSSTVSAERETAALEFAQQNHPELVSLLQNLKINDSKKYQAALVEIGQTIDRLAKIKDADRRDIQLTEWKFTSRIRLQAARDAVSDDPAVEAELRAILRERLEFRLATQRADLDRLQKRVAKLQESVDSMTNKSESLIDKELADVKKSMPDKKANKAKRAAQVAPVDQTGDK